MCTKLGGERLWIADQFVANLLWLVGVGVGLLSTEREGTLIIGEDDAGIGESAARMCKTLL